jgi:hypothetical protein
MKNIIIAFALFAIQSPAIAATILTPPATSEPCTTIQLPSGGTMCAPKLSQRRNAAPKMVKLGDTIRTQYETDAKRLCHSWGGTHLIPLPDEDRAWLCFRKVK